MTPDDALARIDQLLADHERQKAALLDLRSAVARSKPGPEPEQYTDDDFAPENLIDTATAAQRAGVSKPTIRRWANDDGIGFRRGGRLLIYIPRLRRHIGEA